MGIDIKLEDENGKVGGYLGDSNSVLSNFIINSDLSKYVCVRFIDPYGNTIFNHSQMEVLQNELIEIIHHSKDEILKEILHKIIKMIEHGQKSPHNYIKFDGD